MNEQPRPARRATLPDATVEVEPDVAETSVETPLEDAAEQSAHLRAPEQPATERAVPIEVDPADLADQAREVSDDDEEYR